MKKMKKIAKFHVVHVKVNDVHRRYDIYVDNVLFLMPKCIDFPLKRHEAYAIAAMLNKEARASKWADKFSDPY